MKIKQITVSKKNVLIQVITTIACLLFSFNLTAQYTETMDPYGLTKNMKNDYGLIDDNGTTDQSEKLRTAIADVNAQGGGRIIIPKGTYSWNNIYLKSNIHILIEGGTLIKKAQTNGAVFSFDVEGAGGKTQEYIENASIRGIGGRWTVDYSYLTYNQGSRVFIARMVKNFLISDIDLMDNYSTYCLMTMSPTKVSSDISSWDITRATNGTVKNVRHFKANPGYGLVQLHGAQSVYFENIYSHGGVALRLETGAALTHVGVFDITAKNVTCKNGTTAVLMGPHSAKNGLVQIDGVKAISCAVGVSVSDGAPKPNSPDQTPGYFASGSFIKNIHVVFGLQAQMKYVTFPYIHLNYYDNMKNWVVSNGGDKFFDGPSSVTLTSNSAKSFDVNIENVTMEGFTYVNETPVVVEGGAIVPGKAWRIRDAWHANHSDPQYRSNKGVSVDPYKISDLVIDVTAVEIASSSVNLNVGKSTIISATVQPSNADIPSVTWSSSNTNIATVNPKTGVVTAIATGTIIVTATSDDGGYFSDSTKVIITSDKEEPTILTPIDDSYVRGGSKATSNFGNSNALQCKTSSDNYTRQTYLKFDLSSISGSVANATLRLKVSSNNGSGKHIAKFVSDDNWNESSINWNNKPSAGATLDSRATIAANSWIEFDVTSQVITELSGDKNITLALIADDATFTYYHSKEALSLDRPQLVISYTTNQNFNKGGNIYINATDENEGENSILVTDGQAGTCTSLTPINKVVDKDAGTELDDVKVYPNPFAHNLQISFGSGEVTEINLLNTNGVVVFRKMIQQGNKQLEIPVVGANGIYFLKVIRKNQVKIIKVLKI